MKLITKLLPLASVGAICAACTPLYTSCKGNHQWVPRLFDKDPSEGKGWKQYAGAIDKVKALEDYLANYEGSPKEFLKREMEWSAWRSVSLMEKIVPRELSTIATVKDFDFSQFDTYYENFLINKSEAGKPYLLSYNMGVRMEATSDFEFIQPEPSNYPKNSNLKANVEVNAEFHNMPITVETDWHDEDQCSLVMIDYMGLAEDDPRYETSYAKFDVAVSLGRIADDQYHNLISVVIPETKVDQAFINNADLPEFVQGYLGLLAAYGAVGGWFSHYFANTDFRQ